MALGDDQGSYEKVSRLIPKLGADSWKDREKAQEDIFVIFASDSQAAAAAVAEGYIRSKDPEIRLRLEKVLNRMAPEHVRLGERGFLGVSLGKVGGTVKVGEEIYGPIDIVSVLPDTSASKAGITPGERILEIDDFKCRQETTVEDVVKFISAQGPGSIVRFVNLTRDKQVKARTILLGERPKQPDDPSTESVKEYMMTEWREGVLRKAKAKIEAEEKKKK